MTFKQIIDLETFSLLYRDFDVRRGYTVPTTETVKLSNGAVRIEAAFMYSDLANSTKLAKDHFQEDAAKVVRAFLSTVTRVMKNRNGEIRSFDGDRVMGVFIGTEGPSRAAKAALELKWLLDNVVQKNIETYLPSVKASNWRLSHGTGIANGDTLIVRGGVRGSNDLVSIGDAPNIAAKLSELRDYRTWITHKMWDDMSYETCYSSSKAMWSDSESKWLGDRYLEVRHSDWGWVVS
jgi:uridylate cyclase